MFKDFSISTYGGHLVYWSGTILAILVGSYLGNIPMKFESHLHKLLKQIIHDFLFLALVAILFIRAKPF